MSIENDQLRHRLLDATEGRGAFGRFRSILRQHLAEKDRRYAFQENQTRQRILDWLKDKRIAEVNMPDPVKVDLDQMIELRHRLLEEVVIFVRAARRLPGITRIALIGSLTTGKADPNDADLLVTVAANTGLEQLAALGHKLSGHAQDFGRGGEVFLADEKDNYLGRACPWKQCAPGNRASCDALHCGRQLYLCDDLQDIELSKSLMLEPPLELWPEIVARVPLPEDVTHFAISSLHHDRKLAQDLQKTGQ